MKDLSEIKEVRSFFDGEEYVNEKLAGGDWILLDVKIVQTQLRSDGHTLSRGIAIYVIGRIR